MVTRNELKQQITTAGWTEREIGFWVLNTNSEITVSATGDDFFRGSYKHANPKAFTNIEDAAQYAINLYLDTVCTTLGIA